MGSLRKADLALLARGAEGRAAQGPLSRLAESLANLPEQARAPTLAELERSGAVHAIVRLATESLAYINLSELELETRYNVLSILANLADLEGHALVRASGGFQLMLSQLSSTDETIVYYAIAGVQNMISDDQCTEQLIRQGYEPTLQLLTSTRMPEIAECAHNALTNVHTMLTTFRMSRVYKMHSESPAGLRSLASFRSEEERERRELTDELDELDVEPSDALRWRAAREIQRHTRGRLTRTQWQDVTQAATYSLSVSARPPRLSDLNDVALGPLLALVKHSLRSVGLASPSPRSSACWLPHRAVAARSSFRPGWNVTCPAVSALAALVICISTAPSGEPR
jgi:hypothetical protein